MRRLTIKDWALECLSETDSVEAVWRSCQDKFPHSIVSWGYIRRIARERRAAQSDDASRKREG